jgi:hypothetical protein
MEGSTSMSDGDPYGRRGSRQPNDPNVPQSWSDEPAADPYETPPPRAPRRTTGSVNQPQSAPVYNDPNRYPPQSQSRRETDPYAQQPQQGDFDWSQTDPQGAQWPDRPYADPRTGNQLTPQQQRRTSGGYPYPDDDGAEEIDDWENEQYRRGRGGRPSLPRISARPHMPVAVSAALAGQDSRLMLVVAGSLLSLAAMAAVTANRVGDMSAWFPLHIDASGVADKWGSPTTLWRLPLGLAMLTIMNVASSLMLGARDRNLSWILIGSLPLLHLIGWIALIMIGW